ncbi:MAG: biotin--protein ligase [Candidatus Dormibacteraceae bacterium]
MHGEYKVPGGKLVIVDCEVAGDVLRDVQLSGDFFLEPPEALSTLDQALEGMAGDATEEAIRQRLDPVIEGRMTLIGFDAAAIATAVRRALS